MPAPPATPPVILLAFANDRHGGDARWLRNLAPERRAIEAALAPAAAQGRCQLVFEDNVTHDAFFDKLATHGDRLIGIHFGGHADPEGLKFEDALGRPAAALVEGIAAALRGLRDLRFVFLNGCATAAHVAALHDAGVATVIATERAIRDDVAARFARRFYFALAQGHPLAQAFALAEGDERSRVQTPAALVREGEPADGFFRMLVPLRSQTHWPWILRQAGSTNAAWKLVADAEAPKTEPTPLEAALAKRKALADAGAPAAVLAGLDQRILDLKRKALHGNRPSAGLVLSDRWHLINLLGRGGFAEVWQAWDAATDETVAVKLLHGQFSDSAERRQRFFRGARQMQQIGHPHVARIIEAEGHDDAWSFFVMAYAAGGDLEQAVLGGRISTEGAVDVTCQVADALFAAHQQGIVHRDVKPSNILLDGTGGALLTDFDLVRAGDTTGGTRTGALGTFLYAAPEAMEAAGSVGPACDVYGLGMTALFALKGAALRQRVLRDPAGELADVAGWATLKAEVLRAIAWEPDARHASARAFAEALRRAVQAERAIEPASAPRLTQTAIAIEWIHIAPGAFWMGSSHEQGHATFDPEAFDDELPPLRLEMPAGFRIARHPTTNADFAAFLKATGHRPPEEWGNPRFSAPDQPVVGVDWMDAHAFCAWLDTTDAVPDGWRADLPTEAEWEYAARGSVGRRYPWGNAPSDATRADYFAPPGGWTLEKGRAHLQTSGPLPVGRHPAGRSPWGVEEMAGTVWEWCRDIWQEKRPMPLLPPADVPMVDHDISAPRVIRGGSWASDPVHQRAAGRYWWLTQPRDADLGFRVVCRRTGGQA
ncbi:MAG: SUMF1/EgtB/PvdO family nonheme iron enzyme [Myxococcales bacterium]|nr:SUMF1/EgtB/PvdO family nonheme iron enzyme [Myxococcales bacterium]